MVEKNEFFFTNDDYEVFDPELVTSTDIKINQQRNIVKNKLLKLHDLIYPTIRDHKLEIYKHYKETNITSLWYCNPRNNWKVDWLGLRYGQNPKIVKEMDKDISERLNKKERQKDKDLLKRFNDIQSNLIEEANDPENDEPRILIETNVK